MRNVLSAYWTYPDFPLSLNGSKMPTLLWRRRILVMTSESTKGKYIFSLVLLQTSSGPFGGKLISSFLCPFLFCLNPSCFSNRRNEGSRHTRMESRKLPGLHSNGMWGSGSWGWGGGQGRPGISLWQICWLLPCSQPWASAESLLFSNPKLFS